jgi:hypothetical protein
MQAIFHGQAATFSGMVSTYARGRRLKDDAIAIHL